MKKNIYLACAIQNAACIFCCTILAVIFQKWWIVFFSILFFSYVKEPATAYFRVCDKCGKHSPEADTYNNALEKAKDFGWTHIKNGDKWEDYCPECSVEIK